MAQNWETYNKKSLSFYSQLNYSEAIQYADSALKYAEIEFGKKSEAYISSLSNKANAEEANGSLELALKNFKEAYAIINQLHPQAHLDHLQTLHDITKVQLELGRFDSSEYYLNEAFRMYDVLMLDQNTQNETEYYAIAQVTIHLQNLSAIQYHRKGQYQKAIEVLNNQLQSIRDIYPENYRQITEYQTTVNNLAAYYNQNEAYGKALDLAKEYIVLVADNDIDDRVQALESLGSIYRNLGNYDSAGVYFKKAIQLIENSPLHKSHAHAIALNNLGELYFEIEKYDLAIRVLNASLHLQEEKSFAMLYRTTLFNLAEAYHWLGDYPKADSVYTLVINDLLLFIRDNFTYLSDEEKVTFYQNQREVIRDFQFFCLEISGALPLQGDNPYIDPNVSERLYNLQLATKAIVLSSGNQLKESVLSSQDENLKEVFQEWTEDKNKLSALLLTENSNINNVTNLQAKVERNEKWLIQHSKAFKANFTIAESTWKDVQSNLKKGEVAIELIRMVDGLAYAALIVTPDVDKPVLSMLMSRKSMLLEEESYANYINSILFQRQDTVSYQSYWKPVMDSIMVHTTAFPERIFVSNEGIYNNINLNALWVPEKEKYLLDVSNITIVSNTRQLLNRKKRPRPLSAVLFGNPDFTNVKNSMVSLPTLPGTEIEVQKIEEVLKDNHMKVETYLSSQANEDNLKKINQPNVLHIATHGYFNNFNSGNWTIADNMIRSGLIFSASEKEDGILTAMELSTMRLDSTQLVVLSACETARTDQHTNEGIYGLQRALHIAGAQNIIMSLWKVDDNATQQLMSGFYKYWMEGDTLEKAFLKTQQDLRKEYPEPYYWGAFILSGE